MAFNITNIAKTAFFITILFFIIPGECETFPTPKILKDKVSFWKKIYAELSIDEGIIHDSDYPLIIYRKIKLGKVGQRQKNRIIRRETELVKTILVSIVSKPESTWTVKEKEIFSLFKKYASIEALRGATDRIRFQRGLKERFRMGLYRSGAYLDSIRAVFKQYNIPERLIYLPHVESSFNPYAYSKVGAAGMWQFMRGTGRLYMKINYTIDERRDPFISTHAAAKLLLYNYNELKSWPLAITAYNHGLNGMKRAVAQTGSRDISVIIQKYKGRLFKFASKNFYSCFLAASEIAFNPKKYFPDITFMQPLKYQDITLDYYMRPNVLAKYIGISKNELKKLNPSIRQTVFKQNRLITKGTKIHIPFSLSMEKIALKLKAIPDSLKIKTPPRPKYYRVRRGDNLYTIARRLGVSAKGMALENNINRMNRIYAGQILRIPETSGSLKKTSIETVAIVDKKKLTKQTGKQMESEQINIYKDSTDIPNDILMATAETIPESNFLVKTRNSYKFDAEIYNLDIDFSPEENSAIIKISVNETIGHYAYWLDIPTQRIREINYMGRRSTIWIGQELTIPVDSITVEQFNRRRLEYHMSLEEDFYNQYKVTELKLKIISSGENFWDICNTDGVIPLWLLKKYNKHINLGRLFPKMRIWLPVVEEKTEIDFKQEASAKWRGIYPSYLEPCSSVDPIQLLP